MKRRTEVNHRVPDTPTKKEQPTAFITYERVLNPKTEAYEYTQLKIDYKEEWESIQQELLSNLGFEENENEKGANKE